MIAYKFTLLLIFKDILVYSQKNDQIQTNTTNFEKNLRKNDKSES